MKTKLLSLFVALIATNALWASNTITYAATIKLTRSSLNVGETTFGPAITSHTFSNGTGTITCSGEVTTIGEYAFSDCSGLTSVTIPNSITTIGNSTFYNCSGLTSVTIPNSVTTIGKYAFDYCSGLTKTNYTGTIADWCKIKFGGSSANPMSCSHNFYINDVEVKDLVIPEGVDTIGDYAFYNCSGLTSVTIPNSVTTIGNYAFYCCNGVRTITCYAVNPPTATGTTFEGISQYTKTYVLASSLEDYQFAIGWMDLNLLPIGEPTDLLSLPFEEKEGIGSAKFIHNGQLFIRRNGVLFNAHGARVK